MQRSRESPREAANARSRIDDKDPALASVVTAYGCPRCGASCTPYRQRLKTTGRLLLQVLGITVHFALVNRLRLFSSLIIPFCGSSGCIVDSLVAVLKLCLDRLVKLHVDTVVAPLHLMHLHQSSQDVVTSATFSNWTNLENVRMRALQVG